MMKRIVTAALMAAAPFAAGPAAAQNWNAEYETTAKGYRVGNPEAPIELIEFNSYTCPHCAAFARESEAGLRYLLIHEGRANIEVRQQVHHVIDVAAILLAECGPDDRFFDNHRALLLSQDEWMGKARAATQAQRNRWYSGPIASRMKAIAADLDLDELMERRGYSASEIDQCLSDSARAQAIVDESAANAAEYGVQGTPSFVLNGKLLDGVYGWPALENALGSPMPFSAELSAVGD
ncbi:DsbA family protein [Aurantiacibacter spongiae]|uniref:Protein-disulfide isomerase n=1 Tax=Aurantiacibacter spongiae TaxID=2488860 RepID=A0A3N5DJD4_9SPHN|nr:thioredoxin domain-containing protein [Aurantiacibacter spongiae]RPF70805.1 protein-disulfide isomerase [Aurantiacibacter spongiae]